MKREPDKVPRHAGRPPPPAATASLSGIVSVQSCTTATQTPPKRGATAAAVGFRGDRNATPNAEWAVRVKQTARRTVITRCSRRWP